MPWTTPKTWAVGDVLTAADLDSYVRDNTNFLRQAHAARVWTTVATTNIPTGVSTAVAFDSESFDTDGFHDPGTNPSRFTVPSGLDGYYQITGSVEFEGSTAGTFRSAQVWLNGVSTGTLLISGKQTNPGAAISRVLATTTFRLAVADYVELAALHDAGVGKNMLGGTLDDTQLSLIYMGL